MTDTTLYPSAVRVLVNEWSAGVFDLPDDPADHRGILSWHAQLRNKRLSEAGSYGYLIQAAIPAEALTKAEPIQVRLEVDESLPGGLALYGKDFGRYPLDPTILFVFKK
jgi:predicted transcriptional regulator